MVSSVSKQKKLLTLDDIEMKTMDTFVKNIHSDWLIDNLTTFALEKELFKPDDCAGKAKWQNSINFGNYFYPKAPKDLLRVASLFIGTLYYLDDQYDLDITTASDTTHVRQLMEDYLHVIRCGEAPAGNANVPFWRICQAFHHEWISVLPSMEYHARLLEYTAKYLFRGSLIHMKYWKENKMITDLESYKTIRSWDTAALACGLMVQLTGGCFLPTHLHHDERITKWKEDWGVQIGVINDVVSYHKEVNAADSKFNFVHIMMVQEKMSLAEAVDHSIRLANELAVNFEKEANVFLTDPENHAHLDVLSKYIDHMRQFYTGHAVYSKIHPRYCNPLDVSEDYVIPTIVG